jgi:hypothetical protein
MLAMMVSMLTAAGLAWTVGSSACRPFFDLVGFITLGAVAASLTTTLPLRALASSALSAL